MWIGTEDSGLFQILPGGEVVRFTMANGLPDAHISTLLEDKNGRIMKVLFASEKQTLMASRDAQRSSLIQY